MWCLKQHTESQPRQLLPHFDSSIPAPSATCFVRRLHPFVRQEPVLSGRSVRSRPDPVVGARPGWNLLSKSTDNLIRESCNQAATISYSGLTYLLTANNVNHYRFVWCLNQNSRLDALEFLICIYPKSQACLGRSFRAQEQTR